ncbi:MAG: copper resistance protein B [Alcanivoracaceae bacterium]|nr:copper resistance protein B [Alcanivoracaceae bacterium]
MTVYQRFLTLLLLATNPALAEEQPHSGTTQFMAIADQLEFRDSEGRGGAWDVSAWLGRDIHKLAIASEGEREGPATESAETRLALQRAVTPFWDLQLGWRRDWQPDERNRDWGMLALTGTAPYFVETTVQLFAGGDGRSALRLEMEKEILFTQRLHLVPDVEATLYGQDDPAQGVGHGLSSIEAGLRLRYEMIRQVAPYVGVNWEKAYSRTADYARRDGEAVEKPQFVAGVRLWY